MELVPKTKYQGLWWYPDPGTIGEVLAPYDDDLRSGGPNAAQGSNLLIARFHYFGRRRRWRRRPT